MQPEMPRNGNHSHSGTSAGPALSVLDPLSYLVYRLGQVLSPAERGKYRHHGHMAAAQRLEHLVLLQILGIHSFTTSLNNSTLGNWHQTCGVQMEMFPWLPALLWLCEP